jgi:UDP-glucose 4-epimerase
VLYLSQAVRLAGKLGVPIIHPLGAMVGTFVRQLGLVDFSPEQLDFLLFGRVADNRRLKEAFGYTPRYSTAEAFKDFVARARVARMFSEEQAEAWERNLYDMFSRIASSAGLREAR